MKRRRCHALTPGESKKLEELVAHLKREQVEKLYALIDSLPDPYARAAAVADTLAKAVVELGCARRGKPPVGSLGTKAGATPEARVEPLSAICVALGARLGDDVLAAVRA